MEKKRYIEEIIDEKNDYREYYAWDRNTMKEIIKNLLENDDEKFLEDMANDVDDGDEIVIETCYISKFRIATPEELEKASENEKERLEDAFAKDINYDKILDEIKECYESQFKE